MRFAGAVKSYIPRPILPYLQRLRRRLFPAPGGTAAYDERVQIELANYTATESVYDVPPIMTYWADRHLAPLFQNFGFANSNEMFRAYIARVCREHPSEMCVLLSLAAGDAATEINVAQWLLEQGIENFRFECLDLNPEVLARGRSAAEKKGLAGRFVFVSFDIHSWQPAGPYHAILAIQCLHHFVELEILFDKIFVALHDEGYFLTDDMIGRNGHQRWPEALRLVDRFWKELPKSHTYNCGLKRFERRYEDLDCSVNGFEGVRAQDILPLLVRRFHFDLFVGFGNAIDVFVDRVFGPNFNPQREWDRTFIDRVHATDMREIEAGRLKPTHIHAAMMKRPASLPRYWKHLTPEFCIRRP